MNGFRLVIPIRRIDSFKHTHTRARACAPFSLSFFLERSAREFLPFRAVSRKLTAQTE